MKCPICAQELGSGAKFCDRCGKRIPRCPTCGEVLYEKIRFCPKDGTPLPPELFDDIILKGETEAQVVAGISAVVTETLGDDSPAPEPPVQRQVPPTPSTPPPTSRPHPVPPPPEPPRPRPAPSPEPPQKKNKGKGVAVVIVVVLLLLVVAAAAAFGTYYILQNGLPFLDRGEDVSSSEDSSRDGDTGDKSDEDEGDDAIQKALDRAEDYADSGKYERALKTIRDALEENPKSRELKDAQTEYEEQYVDDIIRQVDQLMDEERFEEAQTKLDDGLALVPAHGDLLDKLRELEDAMLQAGSAPPVTMSGVVSITASSWLSEPNLNLFHTPDRTVDGDLSTAWVEGIDGHGIGESITFRFDNVYRISGMRVNAGYQKSAELYAMNNRPAVVVVHFSDGTERTVQLQDINSQQDIPFGVPAEADSVTLTISSVYAGTTYEDTVFSEISFY